MFQIPSFEELYLLCFLWNFLNLRLIDVKIHQKNVPVYKTHPFVSCGDGKLEKKIANSLKLVNLQELKHISKKNGHYKNVKIKK